MFQASRIFNCLFFVLLILSCVSAAWECPEHSGKVDPNAPDDVAFCYCIPGYFGDLLLPGSSCQQCPGNSSHYGNHTLTMEACQCDSYFYGDLMKENKCNPCPLGLFSMPGSKYIEDCICLRSMDQNLASDNKTKCMCPNNYFHSNNQKQNVFLHYQPISNSGDLIELRPAKETSDIYAAFEINTTGLWVTGSAMYQTTFYLRAEDDQGVFDVWRESGTYVNLPQRVLYLPQGRGAGLRRLFLDSY
eukprot:763568-Hanusia_phi.AAC.2